MAAVFSFLDLQAIALPFIQTVEQQSLPRGEYPPGVEHELKHNDTYRNLYNVLKANVKDIQHLLVHTTDQATYEVLYNECVLVANKVIGGRVLVCLPDGTVAVDTRMPTDFSNTNPGYANSYQHFVNKNVNENQNSRISIRDAQTYPAGVGVGIYPGNSGMGPEPFTAIRLGDYLKSKGTARISIQSFT